MSIQVIPFEISTMSTSDDDEDMLGNWDVIPMSKEIPKKAKGNKIRTSKYTLITFLPKDLWFQFSTRAELTFFLAFNLLNLWDEVQAFASSITFIPLLVIILVNCIKDFLEDRTRHKSDSALNGKKAMMLTDTGKVVETNWQHLKVGTVVQLKADESLPADVLLLHSSDPNGLAYVDTAELDGETNLKAKTTFYKQDTAFDIEKFKNVSIRCEEPNVNIYDFIGSTEVDGKVVVLSPENLMLRGSVLRNTTEVWGIVLYAGPQTKAMLNNTGPRLKTSKLDHLKNYGIMMAIGMLISLCSAASIASFFVDAEYTDMAAVPFFAYEEGGNSPQYTAFLRFWIWAIILQSLIPLSLFVSLEVTKVIQVFFINNDLELYDEKRDTKMQCRAWNITEELGNIEYIFSDKTGTLTQNLMGFRCCSVNGVNFDHGFKGLSDDAMDPDAAIDVDKVLVQQVNNGDPVTHQFMTCMAIGNTVRPTFKDVANNAVAETDRSWNKGDLKFEAESPDEQAFVTAAEDYKYTLVGSHNNMKYLNINGKVHEYEVLAVLEFDSDRKRMSIVAKAPDGGLVLYCKGADAAILSKLSSQNDSKMVAASNEHVDAYARLGLRTLVFSYKKIDSAWFGDWNNRFTDARNNVSGSRQKNIDALMEELESDLMLLGVTGVEDALQPGVPDTIADLRHAGMNVWMLTGDKQETAIEIAYTCKLFTRDMEILFLNSEEAKKPMAADDAAHVRRCETEASNVIKKLEIQMQTADKDCGLVVDGRTLKYCLDISNKKDFVNLAIKCKVVVGCRSTPIQKSEVVRAVRDQCDVVTLAIGDGGNDASMIQSAHVGVGISGREGMQAVMASDFAISEFRFLKRLLLVHGSWCYARFAYLILCFFFKNTIANIVPFFYGINSLWSGTIAFDSFGYLLYYVIFTSFPPLVTASMDESAPQEVLLADPTLYGKQPVRIYHMAISLFEGCFAAAFIYFITVFFLTGNDIVILQLGELQLFCCIMLGNFWTLVETKSHTWISWVGQIIGPALYALFVLVYQSSFSLQNSLGVKKSSYMIYMHTYPDAWFWQAAFLICAGYLMLRVFIVMVFRHYFSNIVEYNRQEYLKVKRGEGCGSCTNGIIKKPNTYEVDENGAKRGTQRRAVTSPHHEVASLKDSESPNVDIIKQESFI
eukprot:m.103734 g.103734  ORF g.103734 m.103734 type:complete len:1161 (-) comp27513_c2_seq3:69-3551(-)